MLLRKMFNKLFDNSISFFMNNKNIINFGIIIIAVLFLFSLRFIILNILLLQQSNILIAASFFGIPIYPKIIRDKFFKKDSLSLKDLFLIVSLYELESVVRDNIPPLNKLFYIIKYAGSPYNSKLLYLFKQGILSNKISKIKIKEIDNKEPIFEFLRNSKRHKSYEVILQEYESKFKRINLELSSLITITISSKYFLILVITLAFSVLGLWRNIVVIIISTSIVSLLIIRTVIFMHKNKYQWMHVPNMKDIERDLMETSYLYELSRVVLKEINKNKPPLTSLWVGFLNTRYTLLSLFKKTSNNTGTKVNNKILLSLLSGASLYTISKLIQDTFIIPKNKELVKILLNQAKYNFKLFQTSLNSLYMLLDRKLMYLKEQLAILKAYRLKMKVLSYISSIVIGLIIALSPFFIIISKPINLKIVYVFPFNNFLLALILIAYTNFSVYVHFFETKKAIFNIFTVIIIFILTSIATSLYIQSILI